MTSRLKVEGNVGLGMSGTTSTGIYIFISGFPSKVHETGIKEWIAKKSMLYTSKILIGMI
jgi:hypothetical protein